MMRNLGYGMLKSTMISEGAFNINPNLNISTHSDGKEGYDSKFYSDKSIVIANQPLIGLDTNSKIISGEIHSPPNTYVPPSKHSIPEFYSMSLLSLSHVLQEMSIPMISSEVTGTHSIIQVLI